MVPKHIGRGHTLVLSMGLVNLQPMDVSSGHCYKTSPNYKFMTAVMLIMILDLPPEQSSGSSLVEVGNFPSATCTKIVL